MRRTGCRSGRISGMSQPTFSGSLVTVGDHSWSVPYPVRDARRIGERIVVIYDYMAVLPQGRSFANLEAFDETGRKLWTAENPTTWDNDAYIDFMSEVPLVVSNWTAVNCTIDPETGKILGTLFTK